MTPTSRNRSGWLACSSRRAYLPSSTYGTAGLTTGRTGRTWWIGTYERQGRWTSDRPREHLPRPIHRNGQPEGRRARRARGDGRPGWRARDRAAAVRGDRRSDQSRGPVLPRSPEERGTPGNRGGKRPVLVGGRREILRVHPRPRARCLGPEDRRPAE